MNALYYLGLCAIVVLTGCNAQLPSPLTARVGQSCEVQFRRDALGAAAPNGISPDTGEYNGMAMSVIGRLTKVFANSILLRKVDVVGGGESEYVIPMDSVLYLKFMTADPAKK
jgi:hypothetical protein